MTQGQNTRRPRSYGDEPDRGYERAIDAHTDQIAFTRTARWREWVGTYASLSAGGLASEGLSGGATIEEECERIRLAHEIAADFLRDAEPFYVSSDVCDLIEASRHTLPPVELREADLFVPNGFVWLERPLDGFLDDGTPLNGFAWASWDYGASHRALGTSFCGGFPLVVEIPFPGVGETTDYEFPLAKLLAAFWLLSQQRLFVKAPHSPSRAVRRRAKGREIQTVTVVTLRRASYPETDGTRKVDWSHRWLTRGHWRNQWFPSEQRHKPIWIADFVKGPADKPFVAKRRAFEFRR